MLTNCKSRQTDRRFSLGLLIALLMLLLSACGASEHPVEPTATSRPAPVPTFTPTTSAPILQPTHPPPPPAMPPQLEPPQSEPPQSEPPMPLEVAQPTLPPVQYQPMAYVRHNQLIVTTYPYGALEVVDQCQTEGKCGFAHLRWSPDGSRLAYFKYHHRPEQSEVGLYVWDEQTVLHPITTSTDGKLNNIFTPAWSPDSSGVAYVVDTGNITQLPVPDVAHSTGIDSGTMLMQAEVWVSYAPFIDAGSVRGRLAIFTGFGGYPNGKSEELYWREGVSRDNGIGAAQRLHWRWDDVLLFTRSPLGAGIGQVSLASGEELPPRDANQWLRFTLHQLSPRLAAWTWDRQLIIGRADRQQHDTYALPQVIPAPQSTIVTGSVQTGDLTFSPHGERLYYTTRTLSHITPLLLGAERYQELYGALALYDAIPAQVESYRTALFVVRTDSFFQPQMLLQSADYAYAGLSEAANGDLLFVHIENETALLDAINAQLSPEEVQQRIPQRAIMRLRPNQGEPEMLVSDAGQLALADNVLASLRVSIGVLPTPTPQPATALAGDLRLPASLYFLADDHQIWRRAPTGELTQITHEATGVTDYDLSTQHGRLVYVTNNYHDLVEFDPATQQRTIKLADADQSVSPMISPDTGKVRSPRYSPDGSQISFAYRGINLVASGLQTTEAPQVLVPDNVALNADGQYGDVNQLRGYREMLWSPDGASAALYYGGWEWAGYDLYNLQTGELQGVNMPDGRLPFSTNRYSWWWGRHEPIAYISTLDRRVEPGLFRYAIDQARSVRLQTELDTPSEVYPRHGTLTRGVYEMDNGDLKLFLNTGQITSTGTYTEVYHLYDLTSRRRLNESAVTIAGDVLWAEDGSGALVVTDQMQPVDNWTETTAGAILWVSATDNTTVALGVRGHQLRWGERNQ